MNELIRSVCDVPESLLKSTELYSTFRLNSCYICQSLSVSRIDGDCFNLVQLRICKIYFSFRGIAHVPQSPNASKCY
jgi:hypothetical protein